MPVNTNISPIETPIVAFLQQQTVMTIATCCNNLPHCAMCFYVYVPENNWIVFKSKPTTTHVIQATANACVAGTVLPDKLVPAKTSGLQYTGIFRKAEGADHHHAAKHYYRKYPFAAVMPGDIWIVALDSIVFTDATLGFGKKRKWAKTADEEMIPGSKV